MSHRRDFAAINGFNPFSLIPCPFRIPAHHSRRMKNPIPFLRHVALVEGVSFLVLLGIAMPLKYLANMPMAVKVAGWIHGVLFVLFCAALLRVMMNTNWSFARAAVVFIASLLPFGPFLIDRKMREWEKDPSALQADENAAG